MVIRSFSKWLDWKITLYAIQIVKINILLLTSIFPSLFLIYTLFLNLLFASTLNAEKDKTSMRIPLPAIEEISKLPPDGGKMFNRLIFETSPYLRQHARNPVNWFPWGKEAFEKARKENKPIFLSVGYSSCHWCHVMEHESFENNEVADLLNENYIAIKVDREERPDIDQIYMNATQLLTRHGGWPNSVWLDDKKRPWFCGTYFPKDDRPGRPGFIGILKQLARVWNEEGHKVRMEATRVSDMLKRMARVSEPSGGESQHPLTASNIIEKLSAQFDDTYGGFGDAPKFPPHGVLNYLLHILKTKRENNVKAKAMEFLTKTLNQMAMGGIYDQVGGGFHRYATDEKWFLPHFEKMLYDNAQLARIYANAFELTGNKVYERISRRTIDWALRDMTDTAGGFYSALDADSEGVEGKYYLWNYQELVSSLGTEQGTNFAKFFNATPVGNYFEEATRKRTGENILFLKSFPEDMQKVDKELLELRKIREMRIPPELDDKTLTAWNGLMIGALAVAGRALNEKRYIKAAQRASEFILSKMKKDGRLLRTYRAGEARLNAYLDDYAFMAEGLLDLYETTREKRWLEESILLMKTLQDLFSDDTGGFYFTSSDHENLLTRNKDPYDSAIPSGNGVACRVMIRLAKYTGNMSWKSSSQDLLNSYMHILDHSPRAVATFLLAHEELQKASPVTTEDNESIAVAYKRPLTVELYWSGVSGQIKIRLDKNWHINAHIPGLDFLIPTKISYENTSGFKLAPIAYPEGREFRVAGFEKSIRVYDDGDVIPLRSAFNAGAKKYRVHFYLNFQACNDRSCLPPDSVELDAEIDVVP